jgi:hypothetical protein
MEIKTILILLLLGFSGIITYVYVLPHFEKIIPTNEIIPIVFDEPTSSIDIYIMILLQISILYHMLKIQASHSITILSL